MYKDSLIAERVIEHFTGRGIPVLCIHDSFIIDHTREQAVMAEASLAVVGRALTVASKGLGMAGARTEGYLNRYESWKLRAGKDAA